MQTAYDIAAQRARGGDMKIQRYEPKVA